MTDARGSISRPVGEPARTYSPFSLLLVALAPWLLLLSGTKADAQDVTPPADPTTYHDRGALEVRLAETEPGPGLIEAAVHNLDHDIYLYRPRVITNRDVMRARVVQSGGHVSIVLSLTIEGARRMASATAAHLGGPLAIILDGEVIDAPTVQGISDEAVINGDFTPAEAATIAVALLK